MPGRYMLFKAFFVITLSLQVSSLFLTTAWLNDVAGTTTTLQCNWTASADETPTTLFFSPTNTTFPFYFTCGINSDPPYICNRSESTLDRQSTISSLPGSVSMVFMNTQCSDEETSYFCSVNDSNKPPAISQSQLKVKVPPTAPTLNNLHLNVTEYSNITATCTAVVGYPNAGRIIWRVYQNEEIVDLPFKTVNTVDNVPQPRDDKCTVRIQSSVALNVDRYDQNISLACFVTNPDFKPTAPDTCTNPEADLCAQTDSVIVTYEFPEGAIDSGIYSYIYQVPEEVMDSGSDSDISSSTVSMIAMGVVLSAIIIVLIVVIIFLTRRAQGKGPCKKKYSRRLPHIYNLTEQETHYDYINESYYKSIEI